MRSRMAAYRLIAMRQLVVFILSAVLVSACGGPTPWEEYGEEEYGDFEHPRQANTEEIIEAYNRTYALYDRLWVAPDDCDEAEELAADYLVGAGGWMQIGSWTMYSSSAGSAFAIADWMDHSNCPQRTG